jgi:hypothetical protein
MNTVGYKSWHTKKTTIEQTSLFQFLKTVFDKMERKAHTPCDCVERLIKASEF